MISIVHMTTWQNPNNTVGAGLPIAITIPITTAGNTLVLFIFAPIGYSGGLSGVYKLGTTTISGGGQTEDVVELYYQTNIAGGQTTINITFNGPGSIVVYELTPCTFSAISTSFRQGPASTQVVTSLTSSGNCAFLCCVGQGSTTENPSPNSYTSVSSPWSFDTAQHGYSLPRGCFATASLLNVTGTQQPTFTTGSLSINATWNALHVAFLDAGPVGLCTGSTPPTGNPYV